MVGCNPDKKILLADGTTSASAHCGESVAWNHALNLELIDDTNYWLANKAMANFSVPPMPDIGIPSVELWREFAQERICLADRLDGAVRRSIRSIFAKLTRPITLIHTKGNSFQQSKSVPDPLTIEIYRSLLDQVGGTLLLLDWDTRVPRIAHGQIRHLTDDFHRFSVEELLAAIIEADLLVGIDSGPLHLCRFTDTPAVGLWFNGHHPAKYSLPREHQVNIAVKKNAPRGNKYTRWFYNIVEEHGDQISGQLVGRCAQQILAAPRYLSRRHNGKDVLLQHWIEDWTRGGVSHLGSFVDRDKGFDLMLRHLRENPSPRLVETGCIRAEEDWRGAGFSTYLLGAFACATQGRLDSVDCSPENCDFAARWIRIFGDHAEVHCSDSVGFLQQRNERIDLLYLDSCDTTISGHAEHGLLEIQAAERLLQSGSMVVFDDTCLLAGEWRGKGRLGVPWLMNRGWRTLYSGHQTLLVRAY
jgi:hypothetical protein